MYILMVKGDEIISFRENLDVDMVVLVVDVFVKFLF